MSTSIRSVDVLGRLNASARAAKSQAAWGRTFHVSRQFAHAVLNGERSATTAMLDAIGVEKIETITYVLTGGSDAVG